MTDWQDRARTELGPKIASSAYVITIDPGDEIDPKVALETGYAVLLGKPIILVTSEDRPVNAGLSRIASHRIRLTEPLASDAGQQQLMAGLSAAGLGRPS
jgi:nucleoside 2-deoxyribosyltransferase